MTVSYSGPLVTAVDVKHLPIESDINPYIEILPVPALTQVILRKLLPLNKLTLWYSRVLYHGFHHRDRIIFKVVVDSYISNAEMLIY